MADRQQRDQMKWTNWCFKRALVTYYKLENSSARKLPLNKLQQFLREELLDLNNEEINELYLQEVCKLSTPRLNIILQYNAQGKQRRSPHTVERIMDELLMRATNPETRPTYE